MLQSCQVSLTRVFIISINNAAVNIKVKYSFKSGIYTYFYTDTLELLNHTNKMNGFKFGKQKTYKNKMKKLEYNLFSDLIRLGNLN